MNSFIETLKLKVNWPIFENKFIVIDENTFNSGMSSRGFRDKYKFGFGQCRYKGDDKVRLLFDGEVFFLKICDHIEPFSANKHLYFRLLDNLPIKFWQAACPNKKLLSRAIYRDLHSNSRIPKSRHCRYPYQIEREQELIALLDNI